MATRTSQKPESSEPGRAFARAIVTAYAIAAPGANTSIPFTDHNGAAATTFKVSPACSALRVTVSLATGSVFDLYVTDGTTAYTQHFNAGSALTASCLYTFVIAARRYSTQNGDTELTYAFRVATDGVIQTLLVEEVVGAVT